MAIKEGDVLDPDAVNQSLKTLFATGLFADVTIRREGDTLVVRVVENPIINRIAFEGNKELKDEVLMPEVQLRPRIVFRSEERRVGKECVSTCRSRWWPYH